MPKIFIYDNLPPETLAMLQALYSRSPKSVEEHIEKVRRAGSSDFMASYYVGYGHKSIGDCGTTTLFFENVSILAAKAIQDWPLYSGQETSTRYVDYSTQPIHDPVNTPESRKILQDWIDFYIRAKEQVTVHLKQQYPLADDGDRKIWQKAINARCFDIVRGFLPAGVTTQLSWTTNLRQAQEKLSLLKHHPLAEVRGIANKAIEILVARYPASFRMKEKPDIEEYNALVAEEVNYSTHSNTSVTADDIYGLNFETLLDSDDYKIIEKKGKDILSIRPKGGMVPRFFSKLGRYKLSFFLDYGSFRDLQRHRNGICQIPFLTDQHGFHGWYVKHLPIDLLEEAIILLDKQRAVLSSVNSNCFNKQYYIPMGYTVPIEVVYDLPQMVYVTELRSQSTVHPTLRDIILNVFYPALKQNHPYLKLYVDTTPDGFELRRGNQDIEGKFANGQ